MSLDVLLAKDAIADLSARYCQGIDRREAATFMDVWHDDAEWDLARLGHFTGPGEIRRGLEMLWGVFAEMHHYTTNLVVEVDGHRATGTADALALTTDAGGGRHSTMATYHDVYERRSGSWRIASRAATIHNPPDLGR